MCYISWIWIKTFLEFLWFHDLGPHKTSTAKAFLPMVNLMLLSFTFYMINWILVVIFSTKIRRNCEILFFSFYFNWLPQEPVWLEVPGRNTRKVSSLFWPFCKRWQIVLCPRQTRRFFPGFCWNPMKAAVFSWSGSTQGRGPINSYKRLKGDLWNRTDCKTHTAKGARSETLVWLTGLNPLVFLNWSVVTQKGVCADMVAKCT